MSLNLWLKIRKYQFVTEADESAVSMNTIGLLTSVTSMVTGIIYLYVRTAEEVSRSNLKQMHVDII